MSEIVFVSNEDYNKFIHNPDGIIVDSKGKSSILVQINGVAEHWIEHTCSSDVLLSLEDRRLKVWKVKDRVCVVYEDSYIKDGTMLDGSFGEGPDFEYACDDYLAKIRGRTLVFGAYTNHRKEVTVLG